ncbi:MAG TPA: hypothetical protein VGL59_20390 [Polyangia bacterium]
MKPTRAIAAIGGALLLLTLQAGCGTPPMDGEPPDGTFIAFARDFADFRTWPSSQFDGAVDGNVHIAGTRTVYINKKPAAGSTAFDVGTLIVKTVDSTEIFARAKRGGNYNVDGAIGWEWFEMKDTDAGLAIVWRGITPPAGSCPYGSLVGGVCNDCHKAGAANDFVLTPALQLQGM